jgi:hypothetical protein
MTTSVTVSLIPLLWLNDPTTPSAGLGLQITGLSAQPQQAGAVRRYAGGRLRSIAVAGTQRQLQVTAEAVSRSVVRQIENWQGKLLCLRDPMGRKFYGVYLAPQITEATYMDGGDVSFTFIEVSYTEAV